MSTTARPRNGDARELLAPVVPQAEVNGGLSYDDLHTFERPVLVQVRDSNLFVNGDILHVYWGDDTTPVASLDLGPDNINFPTHTFEVDVRDILVQGDGDFEVWFDRVSGVSGDVGSSPKTIVTVKTTIPGDHAPDPGTWPVNTGLPEAVLPSGPVTPPVDDGVEVTIPAWKNMAVGDVLRVNWGSVKVTLAPLEDSQVGQDYTVTISPDVINEAGNSDNLPVSYEIYDMVKNWSLIAPSAFIEVDVGDVVFDAPALLEASNGELDYDALAGADATAIVMKNNDMVAGDKLILTFDGRTYTDVPVKFTVEVTVGAEVLMQIKLPNASLAQVVPGRGTIYYDVFDDAGIDKGRSGRSAYEIVGSPLLLGAPVIREAVNDELDPSLVPDGVHVDIEPWVGMADGDVVMMYWRGTAADGTPVNDQDFKEVGAPDVDNPVTFDVLFSNVSALAGGSVEIYYVVLSGNGSRESEHANVTVLNTLELPMLSVEGESNGELDPALVPNGPKLTIPAWPNMGPGDSVQWLWLGQSDGGQASGTIPFNAVGDVTADVPRGVIEINANGEDEVNAYYIVTYQSGLTATSVVKKLKVLPLSQDLLPPPTVKEAKGDTLDPNDVTDYATVVVAPYAGMASGDTVWVYFGEGSGGGQEIDSFLISDNTVDLPVEMDVPKDKVVFFDTRSVDIYYTVERNNVEVMRSEVLTLNVRSSERWPAPSIEEADGDYLPEEAYQLGVRQFIPSHPDMQDGDDLDIFWEGHGKYYTDHLPMSGGPKDYRIRVLKDKVHQWYGETVQVTYTVTRGTTVFHSEVLNLRVALELSDLAAPAMDQLEDDGTLNLSAIGPRVNVRVPPWSGMAAGDDLHIDVAGGLDNGGKTISVTISENEAGFPFEDFFVIADFEPFVGQTIPVSYRVVKNGTERKSENLMVTVLQDAVALEPPQIPAVTNGSLDPRLVPNGTQVVVPYNESMQFGDKVVVTWDCSNDAGDFTDDVTVGNGTNDIEIDIPFDVIEEGIDATVTVSYVLERGGVPLGTGTADPFTIILTALPTVVIDEAKESNLDPDDVLVNATAVIAETAMFALEDVVTLHWRGETDYDRPYTIAPGDVGKSIELLVPKTVVEASINKVVRVYYTIVRDATGQTETSPDATYNVGRDLATGDLLVLGARNGAAAYRASSSPRYLRAVSAASRQDIVAEWRYAGEVTTHAGSSFHDTKPWLVVHVRTEDFATSILPVHLVGTGADSATSPNAAFGALLKGTGPYAWGNTQWGANITDGLVGQTGYVEISTTQSSMAARKSNGEVVAWGQQSSGGTLQPIPTTVSRVVGASLAFAAIKDGGALMAWGNGTNGGDLSEEAKGLTDVVSVTASGNAFCARRSNGLLVTWGPATSGGDLRPPFKNEPFEEVIGNFAAFAARRADGSVYAWGGTGHGIEMGDVALEKNIASLASATARAFAVITNDRKLIAWGPDTHGGKLSDAAKLVTDAVEVTSTWGAFCVRKENGNIVCWGDNARGANPGTTIPTMDFIQVAGTAMAFAGLLRNGTVVAWGDPRYGGDTTPVAAQLVNIRAIYATSGAFAAIRDNGGVVVWGAASAGNNMNNDQINLTNQHLRYDVEGSFVSPASPQGRALATYRAKKLAAMVE